MHNHVLNVSVNKEQVYEIEDGVKIVSRERFFGRSSRNIVLPKNIDESAIQAVHKHGVLTVTIPKSDLHHQEPFLIEVMDVGVER